ncbi:hypothetical protein B0H14DRAFT_2931001 [Mycena olivaceomarginata]|nr:hypothetical protein B0H14DRAFT_2931001 [Mycena olivaceomarginata]
MSQKCLIRHRQTLQRAHGDLLRTTMKKDKASQACASCRRQKSRCEILDISRPSWDTSQHSLSPLQSGSGSGELWRFEYTRQCCFVSTQCDGGFRLNPIRNQYGMLPEDLVPTATTPVWGCVSRVDWTATLPCSPFKSLSGVRSTQDSDPQLPSGSRLSDILSPPEISSMLEIFETRYTPWLCAQIGPLDSRNSLLDIVRCTIASRHLYSFGKYSNPQPSPESIRALLILSVWTPICGTGVEARDGRLLIASAVSMAMNLHLQDESKRASGLRTDKHSLSSDKAAELNESTQRWRLWMYLSISESMLCIGTGRNPVSQLSGARSRLDHITAKLFNIAETALKLRLKSVSDLEDFFNETNHSIRLFSPLPVITPHDTFYWQMLVLQYHAYRLLILHHALRETRTAYERDEPQKPWYTAEVRGHCLSLFWGHTALISAETVLTTFLTPSDLTLLGGAPDNIYVMVGFAATWIFVSNYTLFQLGTSQLGGSSEYLQNMTIERLSRIAHAPDHSAARCGHVLAALMSAWEGRKPDETRINPCLLDISYSAFPVPSLTGRESHSYPLPNLNSDTFTVENPVVLC